MIKDFNWFQTGPIPADALHGIYDIKLVVMSYIIAVLASYVALDYVGRLQAEKTLHAKIYWLLGGSFAMGAGIWSMHFIGMLAFIIPMPMQYDLFWTTSSLLIAIAASGFALYILRNDNLSFADVFKSGILIGLGIAAMHYMGMEGMRAHVHIHYLPSLFFLSILIAITAAEVALQLALKSNKGAPQRQLVLKIVSALVMGFAICGMHYIGMAAAIFTPIKSMENMTTGDYIQPVLLAFFVAGISALIISLALMVSTYYKKMIKAVQNEKDFLNTMLNNLEDGIIACDSNGKITVFNNVLQKYISNPEHTHSSFINQLKLFPVDNPNVPLEKHETPLMRALDGECIHGLELLYPTRIKSLVSEIENYH